MNNSNDTKNHDTIFPVHFYHIKKIKRKYYLYDGDIQIFRIKKFYNLLELIAEMVENESLEILERFHTNDGKEYIYVVDKEDFNGDYLVYLDMDGDNYGCN